MTQDKQLEAAAEKYGNDNYEIVRNVHEYNNDNDLTNGFVDGAKSDAAKQYWYEQFQLEHKHVGAGVWRKITEKAPDKEMWYCCRHMVEDKIWWYLSALWNGYKFNDEYVTEWLDEQPISIKAIEKMAEKEYDAEFDGYDGDVRRIYDNAPAMKSIAKDAWVKVFIKGFTSALGYSAGK